MEWCFDFSNGSFVYGSVVVLIVIGTYMYLFSLSWFGVLIWGGVFIVPSWGGLLTGPGAYLSEFYGAVL